MLTKSGSWIATQRLARSCGFLPNWRSTITRAECATVAWASSTAVATSRRGLCFGATPRRAAPADVSPDLATFFDALTKEQRIVLFLTGTPDQPQCRFTSMLVDLMKQLDVDYGFVNIMEDEELCEGFKCYSDWPTYPQVYVDGDLLGGYDICKDMFLNGSLVALLKEKALL